VFGRIVVALKAQAMAQDLDIRRFFQKAPRDWLRRYFDKIGVLADFDLGSLKKLKVDPLVDAWLALDDEVRGTMSLDFKNIQLLATPAGKLQIIDEAAFHPNPDEVSEKLAELDDFYACALWVFLDRRECWNGAIFYAAADGKPGRFWRKRINMPRLGRLPTPADATALAAAITEIFRKKEGRGDHCVVHPYRRGKRGEREYYFAYPQDHRQTTMEYRKGEITKRPHNPAFEIIFIHDDEQQTLSIWHDGSMDRVKDLQVAFAKAVLSETIPRRRQPDDRVYDLEPLLDPDFTFSPDPSLGIAKVELRKLRVRVLGDNEHVVRIDLGPDTPAHILHARLDAAMRGVPPTLRMNAMVGVRVEFERKDDEAAPRACTFELVWPNSCTLQNDEIGAVIQRMLVDHHIEPRVPRTDGDGGSETH
jgi:hypothetical protein